jgi:hypothetical protein
MEDLRLILLLFGAGVVAVVYAWTRFQPWKRKSAHRAEPVSSGRVIDEPDDAAIQQELERMQNVMDGKAPPAARNAPGGQDESIVVISIIAPEDQLFSGDALQKALDKNDLQHGDKSIFHRLVRRNSVDEPVFSLANMVKPGDFGNGDLRGFSTPGVTLFLELPGPVESIEAVSPCFWNCRDPWRVSKLSTTLCKRQNALPLNWVVNYVTRNTALLLTRS